VRFLANARGKHFRVIGKPTSTSRHRITILASTLRVLKTRRRNYQKSPALNTPLVFEAPSPRNAHEYSHEPYTVWKKSPRATFLLLIIWVCLLSNFRDELRNTDHLCSRVKYGPSRSSKVVDFGVNWKGLWNFVLVLNSNLGPTRIHFVNRTGYRFIASCTINPREIERLQRIHEKSKNSKLNSWVRDWYDWNGNRSNYTCRRQQSRRRRSSQRRSAAFVRTECYFRAALQ